LALSLTNLGKGLSDVGRSEETDQAWEETIARFGAEARVLRVLRAGRASGYAQPAPGLITFCSEQADAITQHVEAGHRGAACRIREPLVQDEP
jgi:hypothetical protein